MLNLPDVTLVCIYTVAHDLTVMALDECFKGIRFGDVKLFTDKPRSRDTIKIEPFASHKDFQHFANYELPKYISTTHLLGFQWDGWIIDPSAWRPNFLDYDYIGAPWWYRDGYNVGNSGFCLRSKALMDYLSEHRDEYPIGQPEDDTLCRTYRKTLPFKWATELDAYRFAFERTRAPVPSFGFHGIFNWPYVLTADRLKERLEIASKDSYCTSRPEWGELIKE